MKTLLKKNQHELKDYFKEARSWADDRFAGVEVSRNRYKGAFLLALTLNCCACFAIAILAPMQRLVPLMVHHYDNGMTTVEPLTQTNAPVNKAQVESDIVRYITHRESFDLSSYRAQFELVNLLSNQAVTDEYLREQAKSAKTAPIHTLGAATSRSVHIYSINFLDNLLRNEKELPKNHNNVAEVVFTLTDIDKLTGKQTEHPFNALISWRYTKPSSSPDVRWKNWDGFQVIRYSKQQRNV
jgi:type IV secretion system protein VirB8